MDQYQVQIGKIHNSISQLAKNEQSFLGMLRYVLVQKRSHFQLQLLEATIQRLRERDIDTLRRVLVDEKALVGLIGECSSLDVLALILKEHHLYLEVNTYNYGVSILGECFKQVKGIKAKAQPDYCFLTMPFDDFQSTKKNDQTKPWNKLTLSDKTVYESRIFLMLEYLVHPIVQYYAPTNQQVTSQFLVIKWLMFLSDSGDRTKLLLISKLAKRVLPIVCSPMNTVNRSLLECFTVMMRTMALKLYEQEIIKPTANVGGFLACLPESVVEALCKEWFKGLRQGDLPKEGFENIFSNVLESGCEFQSLRIIECISRELRTSRNFDVLFKVYQKFVKKQLVRRSYTSPGSFRVATIILLMYVGGFVNTDRIGDQLEQLVINYKNNLMVQELKDLHKDARHLILLLTLCDTRFKSLTKVTQNFLKEMKKIHKIKVDFVEVENFIKSSMLDLPNQQLVEDYNMVQSVRYRGLENIGNTCYVNCFMQVLYMTKRFRLMIDSIGDPDNETQAVRPSFLIHELFAELQHKSLNLSESVKPYKFKKFLMEPFKSSKEEQDAAEFGRLYLEYLLNDLSSSHFEQILQNLFFNKIISQMSCKRCHNVTNRNEKVLDFILPFVASTEPEYISTLFKNYFLPQDLDSNNMFYCHNCKSKQLASTRILPQKFSTCIMLTLNRFLYDRTKQAKVKVFNEILFELEIDLERIVENTRPAKYVLYAFIVHLGSTAEAGHYVSYARNIDENPNLWYTFDDGYVTEKEIYDIRDFNLGEKETPYILFYASSEMQQSAFTSAFRPSSRPLQLSRIILN